MEVQAKPQQTKEGIKKRDEERKHPRVPLLPLSVTTHPFFPLFLLFLLTLHQECVLPLAASNAVVSVAHVDAII